MKLSMKVREENQTPLIKAKLPVSVFTLPFLSGIVLGDSSDLSFNLRTNFSSGPSLKLSYTPSPNSTSSPFSLSLKSGVGLFGSPHNSPLTISANFSLLSPNPSPSFSLLLKPQLGDFSLRKNTLSSSNPNPNPNPNPSTNPNPNSNSENIPNVDSYCGLNLNGGIGFGPERPLTWSDIKLDSYGGKNGVLSGFSVLARTSLPVSNRVVVNCRWGLNFSEKTKLPYLTIDKIGVQRVVEEVKVEKKKSKEGNASEVELLKGMCFWVKRDIEILEKENREMKRVLDEIRVTNSMNGYGGGSDRKKNNALPNMESLGEFERWKTKRSAAEENGRKEAKRTSGKMVSDVESELQKAIKAASS